jgi:hypothetical protein
VFRPSLPAHGFLLHLENTRTGEKKTWDNEKQILIEKKNLFLQGTDNIQLSPGLRTPGETQISQEEHIYKKYI